MLPGPHVAFGREEAADAIHTPTGRKERMQAKDIMTVNVITVTPQTRVEEVAKLLLEKRISAVPVVDAERRIVGIVSEGDLLHRVAGGAGPRQSWWLWLFEKEGEKAAELLQSRVQTAADVMTKGAIAVAPDRPVSEIAALLERRRIKRVPVVSDGKLVGIVSRANLLHALAVAGPAQFDAPSESDRQARRRVLDRLNDLDPSRAHLRNVVVAGGVAHIWGEVDTEEETEASRLLAEAATGVEGVESVEPHVSALGDAISDEYWVGV